MSLVSLSHLLLYILCAFFLRLTEWCLDAIKLIVKEQNSGCDECVKDEALRDMTNVMRLPVKDELRLHGVRVDLRESVVLRHKFYAMRRGHNFELYFLWSNCSKEVTGFKSVEYKSFMSLVEVEAYLFKTMVV